MNITDRKIYIYINENESYYCCSYFSPLTDNKDNHATMKTSHRHFLKIEDHVKQVITKKIPTT